MTKLIVDLYIRVSTDKQAKEGDSLEEQESELKKFCEYRKYQIHKIYIERGKSGGNTKRPEYQAMLKDIKAQKINAVVVKKIDRLSRSLLDFEAFMKLLNQMDIEFISLKENFDTTSAMGKAMLRVALVFAQLEREQTSERLTDVFQYRASQGLYNGGNKPFGYTNVNKELVPYPKEREVIEIMFDKFLDTKSTTQTARVLNETGYRRRNGLLWDKRRIQKILQRPIYKGMIYWKGEVYQGIHQPIISDEKYNQIQQLFKHSKRVCADSKTNALLQKLIFCGCCDSPMTPSHSLNKIKVKYYYYRCTSTQSPEKYKSKCTIKNILFRKAEDKTIGLLASLASHKHFSSIEIPALEHNKEIDKLLQSLRVEITGLEAKLNMLKEKKDAYLDSLILGNFRSSERDIINKRITEMELEEKQTQAKIYKQEFEHQKQKENIIDLSSLKKVFINFKSDHDTLTQNELRDFLCIHIDQIFYHPDHLTIKFKSLPWKLEFAT